MWSPMNESLLASSAYNPILSVTHTQEVLQGKKKVGKTHADDAKFVQHGESAFV